MTDEGVWSVGIKYAGISGLIGHPEVIGVPGGRDVGQLVAGFQTQPMRGSITVHVRGNDSVSATTMWRMFRKQFSTKKFGTLVVNSPLGRVAAKVRLDGIITEPKVLDEDLEIIENVVIPLVSDEGFWWTEPEFHTGNNIVTVTNNGDLTTWLRIHWNGPGGTIILPSRARFSIPATTTPLFLDLNPLEFGVVRRLDTGKIDEIATSRTGALPEGIPAGESRKFQLAANVSAEWRGRVFDPWR